MTSPHEVALAAARERLALLRQQEQDAIQRRAKAIEAVRERLLDHRVEAMDAEEADLLDKRTDDERTHDAERSVFSKLEELAFAAEDDGEDSAGFDAEPAE